MNLTLFRHAKLAGSVIIALLIASPLAAAISQCDQDAGDIDNSIAYNGNIDVCGRYVNKIGPTKQVGKRCESTCYSGWVGGWPCSWTVGDDSSITCSK